MNSVAAVVVTFNRLDDLKKNLEMLQLQTRKPDAIYVIDNASTDDTSKYLADLANSNNLITHILLEKNVGGAGGFSYGYEKACEDGYDWIWLMDDDGRPQNDKTLEILMDVAEKESNYSLINCNVLYNGNDLSFKIGTQYNTLEEQRENIENGIIENCACVFNGSLIGKSVYEKIGTIKKEYFIRGDEVEFMMRCKNNGVNVLTVIESLYFHPKTEYAHLSFLGKAFDYECMAVWKQFFLIRNYVATYNSTANPKQKKTIKRGLELIILGVIIHDKSLKRLRYCVRAIREGKNGIFDNHFRGIENDKKK